MKALNVSSKAFANGGNISSEYTCDGKDISPDISWENVPDGTRSIALIVDDPDAPGKTFVHWVIYNIPGDKRGLQSGEKNISDGTLQGKNDFGGIGYNGPCPPPGKPHRYFYKVYALDSKLDLKGGITKSQLESAMKGHILANGEIMGKYGR